MTASLSQSSSGYQLVLTASGSGEQHLRRERRPRYVFASLLQTLTATPVSALSDEPERHDQPGTQCVGNAVSLNIAAGDNVAGRHDEHEHRTAQCDGLHNGKRQYRRTPSSLTGPYPFLRARSRARSALRAPRMPTTRRAWSPTSGRQRRAPPTSRSTTRTP